MEKKIFLRALEPEDLDFLYEMENDENILFIWHTVAHDLYEEMAFCGR